VNSTTIEIDVDVVYIELESDPAVGRYVFAYTISIGNNTREAAQLMSRFWKITHASGKVEEVRGPGVVGEQPRIVPGESFRYTSAAVLDSPVGSMAGSYQFQNDDGSTFEIDIPAFSLCLPNVVH
jgi:ApaG protein